MSSDLDPAHVEAVARAQLSAPWPKGSLGEWATNERAERLLTSTDPAVHSALLAALVRAGVLSVSHGVQSREGGADCLPRPVRRYVTRWEDVDA